MLNNNITTLYFYCLNFSACLYMDVSPVWFSIHMITGSLDGVFQNNEEYMGKI